MKSDLGEQLSIGGWYDGRELWLWMKSDLGEQLSIGGWYDGRELYSLPADYGLSYRWMWRNEG